MVKELSDSAGVLDALVTVPESADSVEIIDALWGDVSDVLDSVLERDLDTTVVASGDRRT